MGYQIVRSNSKYSLSNETLAHQRKDPSIKPKKVKFRESPAAEFDFKHDFHHLINTWAYRLALVPPSEEVKAKHSKGYGFN